MRYNLTSALILSLLLFSLPTLTYALVCTSFAETQNDFTGVTGGTNATVAAQSFTVSATCLITSTTADWRKVNSPTDSLVAKVYNDSSGVPGSSLETGSSVLGSSLSTSFAPATSTFAGTTQLETSTTYWIVWSRTGSSDSTNYYDVAMAIPSSSPGSFGIFTTSWVTWDTRSMINFNVTGDAPAVASSPFINFLRAFWW